MRKSLQKVEQRRDKILNVLSQLNPTERWMDADAIEKNLIDGGFMVMSSNEIAYVIKFYCKGCVMRKVEKGRRVYRLTSAE